MHILVAFIVLAFLYAGYGSIAVSYAEVDGADYNAFFVSTDGDDRNPGTFAEPFATLERARQAARASASRKTVYLRAGTYPRRNMFTLGGEDSGQTWSHYPPDGYNSAILDGSEMTFSPCGNTNVILIQGGSDIQINGLRIRNFRGGGGITVHGGPPYPDVRPRGCFVYKKCPPARRNSITNNLIHDLGDGADNIYPWGWFAGITVWGDARNTTIRNNVVHDVGGIAILLGVPQMGPRNGVDNAVIANNAAYNTNQAPAAGDLGGYYVTDRTGSSSGIVVSSNFLRDYGRANRRIKGIYLDDGASNVVVRGNVVAGSGTWGAQIHSGNNNRFFGNIFDLGETGGQSALLYQNSAGKGNMTGNSVENNLIITNQPGLDAFRSVVYFGHSPNGFAPPEVRNNINWNSHSGEDLPHRGDVAGSFVLTVDPKLSRPTYKLEASSPVYELSTPFPRQPDDWGEPGFWGPPGYVIPDR